MRCTFGGVGVVSGGGWMGEDVGGAMEGISEMVGIRREDSSG